MYQPWTGGNMDEGWTRWVLEQYGFEYVTLHPGDFKSPLTGKVDVVILADTLSSGGLNGVGEERVHLVAHVATVARGIGHPRHVDVTKEIEIGGMVVQLAVKLRF